MLLYSLPFSAGAARRLLEVVSLHTNHNPSSLQAAHNRCAVRSPCSLSEDLAEIVVEVHARIVQTCAREREREREGEREKRKKKKEKKRKKKERDRREGKRERKQRLSVTDFDVVT